MKEVKDGEKKERVSVSLFTFQTFGQIPHQCDQPSCAVFSEEVYRGLSGFKLSTGKLLNETVYSDRAN